MTITETPVVVDLKGIRGALAIARRVSDALNDAGYPRAAARILNAALVGPYGEFIALVMATVTIINAPTS